MTNKFYDVLEVSPRARPEVIKAAFRALSKIYHPDKSGEHKKAAEISEAYEVLSDDERRAKYDRTRTHLSGKIIGEYRLLDVIAEGGFGTTYLAEHIVLGTKVCIKHALRVSPQDNEVLMEEAKAIWDLRHHSIPAMRGIIKLEDGSFALVMSYVPGVTLEKLLEDKGKLDPESVCWIAERILGALRYMHYSGVVHGDVKPLNTIIQVDTHQVVLVDYGLAAVRPTVDHSSKGYTPHFGAPEQIKGMPLLPESDFYSLGMTMMYALGGDHTKKEVPSSTPDVLCQFIKRLVAVNPLNRPSWRNENLIETLQTVRMQAFGRSSSFLKSL